MKRIFYIALALIIAIPVILTAQDGKNKKDNYPLKESKQLIAEGKELDKQILDITNRISKIVKEYKIMELDNIKVVPFQFQYTMNKKKGFIELKRHTFVKDKIYKRNITGIRIKSIRLYITGNTLKSIESEIYENHQASQKINKVIIKDPTPLDNNTNDIKFTHIKYYTFSKEQKQLKNYPVLDTNLAKIKNNSAFPLRNRIKQQFLIPHLTYFMQKLRFIAESYYKYQKDTEGDVTNFLIKSTNY